MKIFAKFSAVVLAAGMIAAPAAMIAQGPPPYRWEAPPSNFTRDVQRNGFRDGVQGARRDMQNHRAQNVNNRDEFRDYRGPEPRVYKSAFIQGYRTAWRHAREYRW